MPDWTLTGRWLDTQGPRAHQAGLQTLRGLWRRVLKMMCFYTQLFTPNRVAYLLKSYHQNSNAMILHGNAVLYYGIAMLVIRFQSFFKIATKQSSHATWQRAFPNIITPVFKKHKCFKKHQSNQYPVFGAIWGHFFHGPKKIKKLQNFAYVCLFSRCGALAAIHPVWGNRYSNKIGCELLQHIPLGM